MTNAIVPPRLENRPTVEIETLRGLACFSLVWYHAVGAEGSGFALPPDHWVQVITDLMANVRMPLFAMISGYVYALRPVRREALVNYTTGKLHRLLVPGAVAIVVFLVLSAVIGTEFAQPFSKMWRAFLFPYAHFWFLQAIFLILVGLGTLEALFGRRAFWPVCAVALVLYFRWIPLPDFFAMNRAAYLLPYFLCGVALLRYGPALAARRGVVIAASGTVLVLVLAWQLAELVQNGVIAQTRQDPDSLAFGLAICVLLALVMPKMSFFAMIGAFSYTIYLYHPLATSGMRRALDKLGVENLGVNLVLCIAAGVILPTLLELAMRRTALTNWLVLGKKTRKTPARAEAAAHPAT